MQSSWPAVVPDKSAGDATTADAATGAEPAPNRSTSRVVLVPLIGIFVIMLFAALYFARDIALPIVLAFLFAITFSPSCAACSAAAFRRRQRR
jgi:uncharacterized membrane protein YdbT with pleckstrin-like domain